MEGICALATPQHPKQVVIHNAYVLMPSRMAAQLGRMLTGQSDCRHVTVTILTNSRDTTDLSVENQINSHVLAALLDNVATSRDPTRAATFRYYEYQRRTNEPLETLHSKIWVLGDSIFVGSANADLRSFMMDANNGILIQNAPALVSQYLAFINRIRGDGTLVKELGKSFTPAARDKLFAEDLSSIRRSVDNSRLAPYLSDARWAVVASRFRRIVDQAFALTQMILRGGAESRSAGEKFDTRFKMI
jgi:phosphatidylserine/phosphatidylglycerophosphate/cardiolipin synthase-like enzyme